MKAKTILSTGLLAFVALSVVYLVANEVTRRSDIAGGAVGAQSAKPTPGDVVAGNSGREHAHHMLIAYYFHGDARCKKCLTIEEYSRAALVEGFPAAVESGRIEWQAVNIDETKNAHFVDEFELTSSSLVLVDTRAGEVTKWRLLEKVWELVDDKDEFHAYVRGEAEAFMEGG